MLPDVLVLLQNGQLGNLVQFAEGVCGIVGTGVAGVGDGAIGIGDPRVIFSLPDAERLGITVAANPAAHRQIKEFYDEAGEGAELYIMLVPNTMSQTQMLDKTNANGAKKLLDYSKGRARILGSFFAPPGSYVPVVTAGMDADVFTALAKAQGLATEYAAKIAPIRCIVEGRNFAGDAGTLTDLRTLAYNRAAVMAASSKNDGSASVGLALGRLARIPVQRKISRFKDGVLPIDAAYVGAQSVDTFSGLGLMHDKGYIVVREFATATGYRFSGDPVAAPKTDDYNGLARGRVIDKALIIAYGTYIQELDDETTETDAGELDPGLVRYLESRITEQVNYLMAAKKEISRVVAYINPAQNVKLTEELEVILDLYPVGYMSAIRVKLGYR